MPLRNCWIEMKRRTKKNLTRQEKEAIWEVDRICHYCEHSIDFRDVTIDHLVAKSLARKPKQLQETLRRLGLPPDYDLFDLPNLHACHSRCNSRKKDRPLSDALMMDWCARAAKNAPRIRKRIQQMQTEPSVVGAKRQMQEALKHLPESSSKAKKFRKAIRAIEDCFIKLCLAGKRRTWSVLPGYKPMSFFSSGVRP